MNVEFTGRQFEVTPEIRKQVEGGLAKVKKILGNHCESHVILTTEKKRHKAEITVQTRRQPLVAVAQAMEMKVAIDEALDNVEKQAVRYKDRWRTRKRQPRDKAKWNGESKPEELALAVGASGATAVPVVAHAFPAAIRMAEAHVSRDDSAVAMRPLTLEEAIKEAEFRDRDVFVFRDTAGRVRVLHRKRDGKMELIEAP